MKIQVAIIEDDAEFLRRFSTSIESSPEFSLQAVARTGAEGLALIDGSAADIYLVDLGLPDMSGIDVIRAAAARYPDCEIMVITVFGDDVHVIESIEAGATGYILKDSSHADILESIRTLREGGSPVSPLIARKLLQKFQVEKPAPTVPVREPEIAQPTEPLRIGLTEREEQILRALAKGLSNKEIGEAHHISAHTVARHVKAIYRKLAVHSRGEAVYAASKIGLIRF